MANPSHAISDNGDKVVIHGLEVFCAYDPKIDGDSDAELERFDNDRVREIVESTKRHMERGSYPQLVVMHEKKGDEPKSCVGRFTKLQYEERGGVGYIVGDCEVERSVFDRLLATNAFPRRSAEIWQEQNHLSEVALLGRETPRRPLPDTHFHRRGTAITFARSMPFSMGTVGGGLSTFIPSTKNAKDTTMADQDMKDAFAALKSAFEAMCAKFESAADEGEDKKDENAADDMLSTQFASEDGEGDGVHIDIDSHGEEDEDEGEDAVFPASRKGSEWFAMKRENARMARELADMKAQMTADRFGRELDAMEVEGYRIPAARRPQLIASLVSAKDPEALLESWRELFSRDSTGVRIDMSRATVGKQDFGRDDIAKLVAQHAGNPAEFAKAINARINK